MIDVKRLDIVVSEPHAAQVIALLEEHGATGWTRISGVGGSGDRGPQLVDDITGVSTNQLVIAAVEGRIFDALIEELRSLLSRLGGICLVSDAHWLKT